MTRDPSTWWHAVGLTLLSPYVLLGLVPWALMSTAMYYRSPVAVIAITATWTAASALFVCAPALVMPPREFTPRSVLTSEAAKIGGLVRGGLLVFVAAIVGALATMAVDRDFSAPSGELTQIASLMAVAVAAIAIVAVARLFGGLAFRWHLAPAAARRRAMRKAVRVSVRLVSNEQRAAALRQRPFVRSWTAGASRRAPYWFSGAVGVFAFCVLLVWSIVYVPQLLPS